MDDKTGKLEATEYIAVALEEDGKPIGDLMMPAEALEGLSQDEIMRQVFAAHNRLRVAERMLNRQRIKENAMAMGPELINSLAQMASSLMALDVWKTWTERAQHDAEEATYLEGLVDESNTVATSIHEMAKAFEEPLLKLWQKGSEAEDLIAWLWRHLIANAISELEDEHGIAAVRTMPDERLDTLLHKQLFEAQDFKAMVADLLGLYAQSWARFLIDGLDLDHKPLPELRQWLGIDAAKADLKGIMRVRPALEEFKSFFAIPSGAPYYALQEIVATKDFHQLDGIPWPTALIDKKSAKGTAQLRPATMDENPLMPPDEVDAWAKIMWRTRDQLSDLDVDVMDSLAAVYLQQTRKPDEDATASIDDLLAMRGLKPKRGGSGTRGGYTPKQRQEMQAALARIQSIWLDMAEVDAYEDTERGGRRRSRKTIQSRPFVITDRMGQMRIDGFMNVERFIFRPGRVFAHYLHGPGRQTALLNAKVLEFDPYRETWEKRLGRYLTNLWRIRARSGAYMEPLRMQTLLETVGDELNPRRGARTRERLERALDALAEREIISAWQYERWDEDTTQQRNWFESWMQATVLIEPPDKIEEHYQELEQPAKTKALPATSKEPLGTRLKARRQQLGLTQLQAAEALTISQGYYSQLERGKNRTKPGAALAKRIETWLGEP